MGKTRSGIIIHPNGFMETPPPVVDPECPRCSSKLEHRDRKSTRLNSSHLGISYAAFCLKKKIRAVGWDQAAVGAALGLAQGSMIYLAYKIRENDHPQYVFFNDTATAEIYTLSLHDALPI